MVVDINKAFNQEEFLEKLSETNGVVKYACKAMGMPRATYYKWIKEDSFKARVDEIKEETTDHVESKLFEKINGIQVQKGFTDAGQPIIYDQPPSDNAIFFYLKAKARDRGYGDKMEVDHTTKGEKIAESRPIIISVDGIPK
jgi:hypothetical protein